ncbi:MAG: nuclear transport factor 2 family protein, partial [Myxococcales bacterium]
LLTEVLGWSAAEVAETLETTVAAVNSALQRARATLAKLQRTEERAELSETQTQLVARYVEAFERYDVAALTQLLHDDATLSMPPYALWLQGHASIRDWLLGRGAGGRGSRLVPVAACGSPAFGQYRPPSAPGGRHQPWSLIVLELRGDRVAAWNAFLDTASLFPRFGLPLEL